MPTQDLNAFFEEIKPLIGTSSSGAVDLTDIKNSLNRGIKHLKKRGVYPARDRTDLYVYPTVWRYALPDAFQFPRNVDQPGYSRRVGYKEVDEWWRCVESEDNIMAIETELGEKCLLLKIREAGSSQVIHNGESITENGTWLVDSALTDATNLQLDTLNKEIGVGSLEFDIDVSQFVANIAGVYNATMNPVNLAAFKNKSAFLFRFFLPNASKITGFTAIWGSDSSNYYTASTTEQFQGTEFRNGWNRVGMQWKDATVTGTPDDEAIAYVYIQMEYSGTQADMTGFHFQDIRVEIPSLMEFEFYSTYFVKGADGTLKALFDGDGDDVCLLDQEDEDFLTFWGATDANLIKGQTLHYAEHMKAKNQAESEIFAKYGVSLRTPVKSYSRNAGYGRARS